MSNNRETQDIMRFSNIGIEKYEGTLVQRIKIGMRNKRRYRKAIIKLKEYLDAKTNYGKYIQYRYYPLINIYSDYVEAEKGIVKAVLYCEGKSELEKSEIEYSEKRKEIRTFAEKSIYFRDGRKYRTNDLTI